ncbi:MAG TPA: nuclear transport factor 2 family protein [Bryobacteraceae bacterium]|nr:nuclear transport factor 2 family protein [Bryobacteraceae bacterium]
MRALAFLLFLPAAFAQDSDLFKTISRLDAALFDAYNSCDLEKFGSLLADDLEFYHDVTGLSTGKQATVDAVKANICGKVHRDLASGSLRVYPLNHYGAVETGIHLFCNPKLGKCPDGSGVGRFITIWQNKAGEWKATRIISYDHCNNCSSATAPEFRK